MRIRRVADAMGTYRCALRLYVDAGDQKKALAFCVVILKISPGDRR